MKKEKLKAYAYGLNVFILGLTSGWIIPVEFYKPISIGTAIILLLMFLSDLRVEYLKETPKRATKSVRKKKERPPKKKRRKKRK